MPQVTCTLQNFSGTVSGIAFTTRDPGDPDAVWISEVITDELATLFAGIPGYARLPEPDPDLTAKIIGQDVRAEPATPAPTRRK